VARVAAGARAGLRAGALLLVAGVAVALTGRPFLFPSLGPSAFLLATAPDAPAATPRRTIGGHAVGVAAGLVAYHGLAAGLVGTAPPPALSPAALRLTASATVAVGLTAAGMIAADLEHPPACATTLIVGLGLLSTPVEAGIVLLAVALLVAAGRGAERALGG